MIDQRETWVTFIVTKLKHHVLWHPNDVFTAEGWIERLPQELRPADKRWTGIAFQRAKREGVITELRLECPHCSGSIGVDAATRAGHRTVMWVKP